MKTANIEVTSGDPNVCTNPKIAEKIFFEKNDWERGKFIIHQTLNRILKKFYIDSEIYNSNIRIDSKIIDYLFEKLKEKNIDCNIGNELYGLILKDKISLTWAMWEKEIPDNVLRWILGVSEDYDVKQIQDGALLWIKEILKKSWIEVDEKDKRHSTLGYWYSESMTDEEQWIFNKAESVNVDEFIMLMEDDEYIITKENALITMILVYQKKSTGLIYNETYK